LLRFTSASCASSDLAELEHMLVTGLDRVIQASMYGLQILSRSANWAPGEGDVGECP
jgi:hypothetical protein